MVGMATAWQSTAQGGHLAGRVSRGTQPELALRKAVHALGFRYAVHKRLAKGCTPDFTLVRYALAVFVDGCFWHQCPSHGRTTFSGPNASLWEAKMRRNVERDRRADRLAREAGYQVLRVWECEIHSDVAAVARQVERLCASL